MHYTTPIPLWAIGTVSSYGPKGEIMGLTSSSSTQELEEGAWCQRATLLLISPSLRFELGLGQVRGRDQVPEIRHNFQKSQQLTLLFHIKHSPSKESLFKRGHCSLAFHIYFQIFPKFCLGQKFYCLSPSRLFALAFDKQGSFFYCFVSHPLKQQILPIKHYNVHSIIRNIKNGKLIGYCISIHHICFRHLTHLSSLHEHLKHGNSLPP